MKEKLCPSIDGVNLAQKYYKARVMVFVYKQNIKHMMSKSPYDFNVETIKIENSNDKFRKYIANKNKVTLTFCISLYICWPFTYSHSIGPFMGGSLKNIHINIIIYITCH